MKYNSRLLIAVSILIVLLLVCHLSHFFYNYYKNKNNNEKNNNEKNEFANISGKPLKTEYNEIYYYNDNSKIPCDGSKEAQIPCNIQKKCKPTQYQLSDSEIALLYKEAYEIAGKEVLDRYINEIKTNTMTNTMTNTKNT